MNKEPVSSENNLLHPSIKSPFIWSSSSRLRDVIQYLYAKKPSPLTLTCTTSIMVIGILSATIGPQTIHWGKQKVEEYKIRKIEKERKIAEQKRINEILKNLKTLELQQTRDKIYSNKLEITEVRKTIRKAEKINKNKFEIDPIPQENIDGAKEHLKDLEKEKNELIKLKNKLMWDLQILENW